MPWRLEGDQTILGYRLAPETLAAISELIDATAEDGLERGFNLCVAPGSNELVSGSRCIGTSCYVPISDCGEGLKPAGKFHTHPGGSPRHTLGDLDNAAWDSIAFGTRALICNGTQQCRAVGAIHCASPKEGMAAAARSVLKAARDRKGTWATGAERDELAMFDTEARMLLNPEGLEELRRDPAAFTGRCRYWWKDLLRYMSPEEAERVTTEAYRAAAGRLAEEVTQKMDELGQRVPARIQIMLSVINSDLRWLAQAAAPCNMDMVGTLGTLEGSLSKTGEIVNTGQSSGKLGEQEANLLRDLLASVGSLVWELEHDVANLCRCTFNPQEGDFWRNVMAAVGGGA